MVFIIWKLVEGYGVWIIKIWVDYWIGMFMYLYNLNIILLELFWSKYFVIDVNYFYDGWYINYGGLFFKKKDLY